MKTGERRRLRLRVEELDRRPLLPLHQAARHRLPKHGGAFQQGHLVHRGAEGLTVVPLPADDEASSLSAILLDDDYYAYMKSGRKTVGGVTVLDEVHLVPFKAKAFLDLSKRKANGERVDSSDVKKHKKDVFRLVQLFTPNTLSELPESIRADMAEFCETVLIEGVPLKQMRIPLTLDEGVELLRRVYGL